jgi:hypothetical protein
MGCCDPVGAYGYVPVPPDSRLASRSGVHSACQPSNGRTKLEGARRQAASLSPAIGRVVVHRIASAASRPKPTVCMRRQATSRCAIEARAQDTTGVGERGMASAGSRGTLGAPPVSEPNSRHGGPGDHRPGRDLGASPRPCARWDTTHTVQQARYRAASDKRSDPRCAITG